MTRRRPWTMLTSVLAAGAVIGLVAACSSGPARPRTPVTSGYPVTDRVGVATELRAITAPATTPPGAGSTAADQVSTAEQDFTLALLRQLDPARTNLAVSPASLGLALAMLENGAAGTTRTQIAATLHTPGLGPTVQDEGWAALTAGWSTAGSSLATADSVWTQNGFPVQASFMTALARYFAAGVWQADFARDPGAATKALNAWVSRQTHGRIPELFGPGQLDPDTVLVLANTLYLDAAWAQPFDPNLTTSGSFTTADGQHVSTPMMTGQFEPDDGVLAVSTTTYQAVQLPYAGGRLAALAVMPTGPSLAAFVAAMTPASLAAITSGLTRAPVALSLPRFTITTALPDLRPTLSALGMPSAFDPDAADFAALSPTPTYVGAAAQRVYLSVGEKGTEAAAATGIGMEASSGMVGLVSVDFDRPFLFLVRDPSTGVVLFAAEVNDPTT